MSRALDGAGGGTDARVSVGDRVVDCEDEPGERSAAVVLDVRDEPAAAHYIASIDATVAEANPDYPADDRVVVLAYEAAVEDAIGDEWQDDAGGRRGLPHILDNRGADVRRYSFPASRLRRVSRDWTPIPVHPTPSDEVTDT